MPLFLFPFPNTLVQFETAPHGPGDGDDGDEDNVVRTHGTKGVRGKRPSRILPSSLSQDPLTLAVLTLLVGGWLAFALTYPSVSLHISHPSHPSFSIHFVACEFFVKNVVGSWYEISG